MAGKLIMKSLMLAILTASFQTLVDAHDDSDDTASPFRLTRVKKTEGRTSYVLEAEYEADTMPTVFIVVDGMIMEVSHQRLGFVEIQVPKTASFGSLLLHDDHFGGIFALINFAGPTTMEIPRIHAQVQQGSDITFQPGNGAILIDVSLSVDGGIRSDMMFSSVLVKSEKENNLVERYNYQGGNGTAPVKFEPISTSGTNGNRSTTFRLSSSGARQDIEGILVLVFMVDFDCSGECLVRMMGVQLGIRFYREDHTAPFPPGFIGFIQDVNRTRSQVYCDSDRMRAHACVLVCEVAGDHPQAIQLSRLGSNHHDDNQTQTDMSLTGDYGAMAFKVIRSRREGGDYQCTARSSTREISQTISVHTV